MIAACLKNVKNRDPTDYHRWLDGNFGMRAHDKHVKNSMRRVFFLSACKSNSSSKSEISHTISNVNT